MKRFLLILSFFIFFFNSCSIMKFARYYAEADTSTPGKLNGMVYESSDTSYVVGNLPSTWKRIKIKGGDLAYWNDKFDVTITVNSTCGNNKAKYSLKALSNSLVIGIDSKQLISSKETNISGETALQRIYLGKLSGVSIKMSTAVFKKGKCIYDFSYASTPGSFDPGFKDFNDFISQFMVIS